MGFTPFVKATHPAASSPSLMCYDNLHMKDTWGCFSRNSLALAFAISLLVLNFGCSKPEAAKKVTKTHHESLVDWQDWSEQVFKDAKAQNKFVILDLEAIWCHWCHVMDAETYTDPEVAKTLEDHYIAVKVDQDSRPDLSNLYKDYGWPATIIFNANGDEIVKRAGYIEAKGMAKLLKAVVADPDPEKFGQAAPTKVSKDAFLAKDVKEKLVSEFYRVYDKSKGGLKTAQKYVDRDYVEYALVLANNGNKEAKAMAEKTLTNALKIFDKAWGGVYQYSTKGDWNYPHFEKLAKIQGEYMRIYSQAFLVLKDSKYKQGALEIHRYLQDFMMSPEGAFYTSQDADLVQGEHSHDYFKLNDKQRRKEGIPKVDKNIYSYQNGLIIDGLAYLYSATKDSQFINDAKKATNWIIANRSLPGGGFKHDADDDKRGVGPFLNDNLYMARAMLNLYVVTGERAWLKKAQKTTEFIAKNFKDKIGFSTVVLSNLPKGIAKSKPVLSENIDIARFMNLMHHYSGSEEFKDLAEHTMKYLATPDLVLKRFVEPGVLLADMEIVQDPIHMTVVGAKADNKAKDLFVAALSYPATFYKRIEWWDKKEGPLPNPDVPYPDLGKAAAFACAFKRCSLPAFSPDELFEIVAGMMSENH